MPTCPRPLKKTRSPGRSRVAGHLRQRVPERVAVCGSATPTRPNAYATSPLQSKPAGEAPPYGVRRAQVPQGDPRRRWRCAWPTPRRRGAAAGGGRAARPRGGPGTRGPGRPPASARRRSPARPPRAMTAAVPWSDGKQGDGGGDGDDGGGDRGREGWLRHGHSWARARRDRGRCRDVAGPTWAHGAGGGIRRHGPRKRSGEASGTWPGRRSSRFRAASEGRQTSSIVPRQRRAAARAGVGAVRRRSSSSSSRTRR